jgi:hypothetical protein
MKLNRIARVAVIGLAAAAIVGISASTASAQTKPANSAGAFYIANGETDGSIIAEGTSLSFDFAALGRPDTTDINNHFAADPTAESATLFISPRGSELNPSAWNATGVLAFVPGTKDIWQPSASLSSLTTPGASSIDAVRAAGGDYSLGFAYMRNNGLNISDGGVYFAHIHVTATTGAWTFLHSEAGSVTPPTDPTMTGDIDLEATTVAGVDGNLSLSVPAGAKVTFGAATLVNNQSTSTGTLPNVTVQDDRVVSHPGWTLNATVNDFSGAGTSIEKKQLGWTPAVVSAGTTSTGAVAGAAQTAGSANWAAAKLASAPANAGTGTTVLNAGLTFVAPGDKPAGTYTSKMTLTLVGE